MNSWFGITNMGNNRYCMFSGPKIILVLYGVIAIILGITLIYSYNQGLNSKDKHGNPVKWTNHITGLAVGIGLLIFGLIFVYVYFRI